ncbi:hypothetical protein E2320_006625, partial [Naja naja]
ITFSSEAPPRRGPSAAAPPPPPTPSLSPPLPQSGAAPSEAAPAGTDGGRSWPGKRSRSFSELFLTSI